MKKKTKMDLQKFSKLQSLKVSGINILHDFRCIGGDSNQPFLNMTFT